MQNESAPVPGSAPFPGSAAANDEDAEINHYVLGRGDQIGITDYAGQALGSAFSTQTVTVLPDGTASVYPVGQVRAAGKTLAELTTLINERALKYMINPQFLVTLLRARPVSVYVLGDVLNPGIYNLSAPASGTQSNNPPPQAGSVDAGTVREVLGTPIVPESSEAQPYVPETPTVLNALQRAGDLKETANVRQIRVTRARTKEVLFVDLWKLLVDGDYAQDIDLEPRDIIFVARGGANFNPSELGKLAAQQTRSVRIWGSVKQPGLYQLGPNDDVMSVIAKAGGFLPVAVKGSVILSRVERDGTVSKRTISINQGLRDRSIARQPVQAGDVIIVGLNPLLKAAHPLLIAALTIGGAMLVIYFSNRIPNINVNNNTNGTGTNSSNVRVAVPVF